MSGVEDLHNVYSDFSARLVLYRLARYLRDEQESEPGFWLVMRSRDAWYRQIQSVLTNLNRVMGWGLTPRMRASSQTGSSQPMRMSILAVRRS